MKILSKTLFGAAVFFLSAGCINEDMSDCPTPFNTELTFSYSGDSQDPAMFSRAIDGVTLFVFDRTDGQQILQKTIAKADLNRFQGTQLYLPAGDYRIVCWGNAFGDTEILSSTLSQGRIHAPAYGAQTKIPTNDHLYHGDYNITVPAADKMPDKVTGDIPFRGAHIDMEIHVKNFGQSAAPATWPVLEIGNLMPQYDMQMNAVQPFGTTYHPTVAWNTQRKVMTSVFQVLRFDDNNPVTVTVREPDNTVKATIDLRQYMADNGISVDDKHEAAVRMLIEFTDLGISITIPDWSAIGTEPEI